MINHIYGKVIYVAKNYIILESYGIGYKINIKNFDVNIGENKKLFIHTIKKLDNRNTIHEELYGFNSAIEKMLFCSLLSISGVGTIISNNILEIGYKEVIKIIINEDIESLKLIKGINDKLARQIIASLLDECIRIAKVLGITEQRNNSDLILALKELGYSDQDISIVNEIDSSLELEERIGKSIRLIANYHDSTKS